MATHFSRSDQALLSSLPRVNADKLFSTPAWAKESSDVAQDDEADDVEIDGDEEEWADALEDHGSAESDGEGDMGTETENFTDDELKTFLDEATKIKTQANSAFTNNPPDLDHSLELYKSALTNLPSTSLGSNLPSVEPAPLPASDAAIVELTEDQAAEFEAAEEARKSKEAEESRPEVKKRREVEKEIEDLRKVIWGNMGAVYVKKGDDKEVVNACTEALKIEPLYIKALQRRAAASERIASWSSLTSAQEDYTKLLTLLPPRSPLFPAIRKSLATLPSRIAAQQEKEKDEMLGKLKELGDGLLGKFGLSTDMFKFDKGENGGYSMRFER